MEENRRWGSAGIEREVEEKVTHGNSGEGCAETISTAKKHSNQN